MICSKTLPYNDTPFTYSKEDSICGVTIIPENLPPLKELVKFSISPKLISYTILSPEYSTSHSLAFKLLVEVKLTETLSYRSSNLSSDLITYHSTFTKKLILSLPSTIDHCPTHTLFVMNQLAISPIIHTAYFKVLDCHSIYKSALFSLNVKRHYGPA